MAQKSISIALRILAIIGRVALTMIGEPLHGTVEIITILNVEILKPLSLQFAHLKAQLESQPTNPLPEPIVVERMADRHLGATEAV